MIKLLDEKKLKEPEKRVIVKACFVREHGEAKAEMRKYGDVVTVSGLGKAELDFRGLAMTQEKFAEEDKKVQARKLSDKKRTISTELPPAGE